MSDPARKLQLTESNEPRRGFDRFAWLCNLRLHGLLAALKPAELRDHIDIVLGGIPCEWLSNYRNWTEGTRVSREEIERERALLDSCLSIVRRIEPLFWALEDVKGIIKELPPLTPWQEINAADFSPQRRKRVYVGWFPPPEKPTGGQGTLGDCLRPGPYRVGRRLYGRSPQTSRTFAADCCLGAWPDRKTPTIASITSRRDSELGVVDASLPGGLRQLEWQEQAHAQGYPEDYLFYGSPSDVGRMVGRSVQIHTARAILQAMVNGARGKRSSLIETTEPLG